MFNKKVNTKNVSKETIDSTKTSPIPFLERETPITDLESLVLRVEDLNIQIKQSEKNISELEYDIRELEEDIYNIRINKRNGHLTIRSENCSEIIKNVKSALIDSLKSKIQREKDLIHTCQDELDWLQMKIAMPTNPTIRKNRFESGYFNFDPNKNHC